MHIFLKINLVTSFLSNEAYWKPQDKTWFCPQRLDDIIAYHRWFSTSTAVATGPHNFLAQNVAIWKIEDFGNLTGVKDLTNSTSTAVAAAGQQTLLSHDLDRAGAGQPRCPGRIQPHMKRTILSTIWNRIWNRISNMTLVLSHIWNTKYQMIFSWLFRIDWPDPCWEISVSKLTILLWQHGTIHAKNVWCCGEAILAKKNLRKKCVNRDKM